MTGTRTAPPASTDAVLARLRALHPVLIDLGLDRLDALLGRLGRPERSLPPVLHVAGTNGKGSTTAYLRAIARRAGLAAHATISPHLVSITERFVLRDREIDLDALVAVLHEVETANAGAPITVFEVLIACAFTLFARAPADLVILETGLGGRLDATNLAHPACSAITSISLDHQEFLGDTIAAIAAEKAGIIKAGAPAVTGRQLPEALAVLDRTAARLGTRVLARDRDWSIEPAGDGLRFSDPAGALALPMPSLAGRHQHDNAGIAVAAMRAAALRVPVDAFAAIGEARWPARLERLHGALAARLPAGSELWLDGGHNPAAGRALAEAVRDWRGLPLALVVGMKRTKDVAGFLAPLLPLAATVLAVAEPDQEAAVEVGDLIAASGGRAQAGPDLDGALARLAAAGPARVLICGSLYLAGIVLRRDRGDRLGA